MAHKRHEIKTAIENKILDGETLVEARVFKHRPNEIWEYKQPIMVLTLPKEISKKFSETPRILERKAYISLEVVVQGFDFSDLLDEIATQVEDIINEDLTIDCIANDTVLVESSQEESAEGEIPTGSLTLVYEVTYYTEETPPVDSSRFTGTQQHFL